MTSTSKNWLLACAVVCAVAFASNAQAVDVNVSRSSAPWLGFMNVFNLPAPDGDGAFQFGSGWGIGDLAANFDDPAETLTLSPNSIDDPDPYWYTPSGGPGSMGNKIMQAALYIEETGPLSGQTVVFSGNVLSDSLTDAHTATAFIRDFAPDYSSREEASIPLTSGPFSVSLDTINDPARHVQYGFQVEGVDVWITDVEPFGNLVVATVPEPATLSVAALSLVGLLGLRRRR